MAASVLGSASVLPWVFRSGTRNRQMDLASEMGEANLRIGPLSQCCAVLQPGHLWRGHSWTCMQIATMVSRSHQDGHLPNLPNGPSYTSGIIKPSYVHIKHQLHRRTGQINNKQQHFRWKPIRTDTRSIHIHHQSDENAADKDRGCILERFLHQWKEAFPNRFFPKEWGSFKAPTADLWRMLYVCSNAELAHRSGREEMEFNWAPDVMRTFRESWRSLTTDGALKMNLLSLSTDDWDQSFAEVRRSDLRSGRSGGGHADRLQGWWGGRLLKRLRTGSVEPSGDHLLHRRWRCTWTEYTMNLIF